MADAAHAFGATWHGRPVGSIADFSNFSFHAVNVFEAEMRKFDCKESTKMVA